MKTVPLRPSHLPDSGDIFTFTNGVRMEEISRSDRQAKQVKIWDVDCTCPYSPYDHVEVRTIMLTWQREDVEYLYWTDDSESDDGTCQWWPIRDRHMAQPIGTTCPFTAGSYVVYMYKMTWGVRGVRPPDLPHNTKAY
jgi:hypothetical protein